MRYVVFFSILFETIINHAQTLIEKFINSLNKDYSTNSINRYKVTIRNFHRFLAFKYDINDPSINIDWDSILKGNEPVLSEKDKNAPLLKDCNANFIYEE